MNTLWPQGYPQWLCRCHRNVKVGRRDCHRLSTNMEADCDLRAETNSRIYLLTHIMYQISFQIECKRFSALTLGFAGMPDLANACVELALPYPLPKRAAPGCAALLLASPPLLIKKPRGKCSFQ